MIFVRDKGRMCNNMLQYGHVYAWAREHHRASVSMRFAYKYPYFHISDTKYHNFFFYLLGKYGAKLRFLNTVSIDDNYWSKDEVEQQIEQHRHILVEGWYVRFYDLFLKYKTEICQLFTFKPEIEDNVATSFQQDNADVRLGVHIRRGDYIKWYDGKYYYSDEQMIRQIKQFVALQNNKSVSIWICGNDPNIDKAAYENVFGEAKVHFPCGNSAEDLCLLSHCDFIMGAPSTFSLVASMYHDTPLYWILDPNSEVTPQSFSHFDYLFRHIL
ncbi:MAG: alpha-1,2-fucosyltransferase [Prevotella sp.]|nr:alpha-1,2-fucosyltransferase [Prevotella sp.]